MVALAGHVGTGGKVMIYADSGNLAIRNTGQDVVFTVDGVDILSVDITSVDLITTIQQGKS